MAKPKQKLRSDRVMFVSLTPAVKARLRDLALADKRTMSQYAALLIEQELQRRAA